MASALKTKTVPPTTGKRGRPQKWPVAVPADTNNQVSEATERYGDWWEAPHQVIAMLGVTLSKYAENEGKWLRSDVQADLLKAHAIVDRCLERGASSFITPPNMAVG